MWISLKIGLSVKKREIYIFSKRAHFGSAIQDRQVGRKVIYV
jgi:hypothetical protein